MNDNEQDLKQALQQFSTKFYNAVSFSEENFISSPLGVWLLIAQIAGTNSSELSENARHKIENLLGLPVDAAYDYSNELLRNAPEVIKTANAAWINRDAHLTAVEQRWVENLREEGVATVTDHLPSQTELDAWTKEQTLNIIDKFPLDIQGNELLVLANVLATRITWTTPFEEVDNDIEKWQVPTVLFANKGIPQKIVEDTKTGERFAVVHNYGRNLHVHSVIAENPNLTPAEVLEVAEHILSFSDRIATVSPETLEDGLLWTVTDVESYNGDEYSAHLPAWEAESVINVVEDLKFPVEEAAEAISGANHDNDIAMVQSAKAKFNKKGFEAAAVTGFTMVRGSMPRLENRKRVVTKFKHSYAVVANYSNYRPAVNSGEKIWNDINIFSAWVNVASEVTDDDF